MRDPDSLRRFGLFGLVFTELVGFSAAGIGLGYYGFTYWSFPWWIMLLFGCLGMGFGFYRVYRLSQKEL